MSAPQFIKTDQTIIAVAHIIDLDLTHVESGKVTVSYRKGEEILHAEVNGFFALEAVMAVKPSALEGRRFKWVKHAWAVHNLFGHPVMQILAYIGNGLRWVKCPERLYRPWFNWAMIVHDKTTPTPVGLKN